MIQKTLSRLLLGLAVLVVAFASPAFLPADAALESQKGSEPGASSHPMASVTSQGPESTSPSATSDPDPEPLTSVLQPVTAAQPEDSSQSGLPTFPVDRAMPPLQTFTSSVVNGRASQVVGVYVPDVFALPVAQQPAGSPGYVSQAPNTVTQFGMAARFGTTGLLAHNYLSGSLFFDLELGQQTIIVRGDGSLDYYTIIKVERFQALSPNSPYSDFVNLDRGGGLKSATELFYDIYTGSDQIVFQTCIEASGDPSWGRLFVTARPSLDPLSLYKLSDVVN